MSTLTQLINDGDLCSVLFLICLLIPVGRIFVAHYSRLEDWGLRIAAGAAILFAGTTVMEEGMSDAGLLARVVLRSLVAGALILGPTWIILSVGAFFHSNYRRVASAVSVRSANWKLERQRQQREAQEAEHKRQREAEWERSRPAREQAAREASERSRLEFERKQQEFRKDMADHRRREDARLQCMLVYDRYAAALVKTFPRKRLDQYFAAYMSASHAVDDVEQRAKQLVMMLEELAREHGSRSKTRFQTLAEVATFYEQQRLMIRELAYEQDVVDSLLVTINQQEDAAIKDFLSAAMQ